MKNKDKCNRSMLQMLHSHINHFNVKYQKNLDNQKNKKKLNKDLNHLKTIYLLLIKHTYQMVYQMKSVQMKTHRLQ